MKHCLVIHFLCHGAPPVKLVVWVGPRPKVEAEEHWAHASISADGHREEGSSTALLTIEKNLETELWELFENFARSLTIFYGGAVDCRHMGVQVNRM